MHAIVSSWNRLTRGRLLGAPAFIVLAAIILHWLPNSADLLQFDRTAVAAGQLWRLVTCHLSHFSLDHLFWDASVFGVLAGVCLTQARRATWTCLAVSSIAIPVAVWIFLPHIATYRGLSGLDSALFALLAAIVLERSVANGDRRMATIAVSLALAFAIKTVYEAATGGTVFVDGKAVEMVPVPLAHAIGAVIGVACGWRRGPGTLETQAVQLLSGTHAGNRMVRPLA